MSQSQSTDFTHWPISPHGFHTDTYDNGALPSSFMMTAGSAWDTHIGSMFGEQLMHQASSNDLYPAIDSQRFDPVSQNESGNLCQHDDFISLQDVIDSSHHDVLLPDADHPWSLPDHVHTQYPDLDTLPLYANQHTATKTTSTNSNSDDTAKQSTPDAFEGVENADPCYARLLWSCLREAPSHTLSLKDIYVWIREHTQKARDPKNKGWQNSVRHNLSMNAAFERVTADNSDGTAKKGSLWRLTESAMKQGVISTTRYRRDPKRKPERRGLPAIKRQISGAKGGAATRQAAQLRRLRESRQQNPFHAFTRPQYDASTEHVPAFYDGQISPHGHSVSPYFTSPSPGMLHSSLSPYAQPVRVHIAGQPDKKLNDSFQMCYIAPNELFGNHDIGRLDSPSSAITDGTLFADDNHQPPS